MYCIQNAEIALIYSPWCLSKHHQDSIELITVMVSTVFSFLQNNQFYRLCSQHWVNQVGSARKLGNEINTGHLGQSSSGCRAIRCVCLGFFGHFLNFKDLIATVPVQRVEKKSNFIYGFEREKVMTIQWANSQGTRFVKDKCRNTRKDINCNFSFRSV